MNAAREWNDAWGRRLGPGNGGYVAGLAKWLGIDYGTPGAFFAMMPFVRLETDDGPRVAAALEPPMVWMPSREVPAWTPKIDRAAKTSPEAKCVTWEEAPITVYPPHLDGRLGGCHRESSILLVDRGRLHRDPGDTLIIADTAWLAIERIGQINLYTDAVAWARAWARRRQRFVVRRNKIARETGVELDEPGDEMYPGALLIGSPAKIRWPDGLTFACPDAECARAVSRAAAAQTPAACAVVAQARRTA